MGLFRNVLDILSVNTGAQAPAADAMGPHSRTNLNEVIERNFIQGREMPYSDAGLAKAPYSNHSITYTCMSIIAEGMAAVPYKLGKPTTDGQFTVVENHPALQLIHDPFPGIYADWCQFLETISLYLEATGNAFIMLDAPNSRGLPRSLMALGLQHVKPIRDDKSGMLSGWQVKIGEESFIFGPLDLLHFKYTNPESIDQILGVGPMQAARTAINADFARQRYDAAFFQHGARLSAALEYTPPETQPESQFLSPEQVEQVKMAFRDEYGGAHNSHKVAVVHGGFKLKELGMSQRDMDFIEGRRWSRQEIAAVFRVPVPLLNDFQHAGLGREGVQVAQRMLYENNIVPKLKRLQSVLQKFLIDRIAPGYQGVFDLDAIPAMREDVGEKSEIAERYWRMGFPLNEINRILNLGFKNVPWGDHQIVPMGQTTAQQIVEDAEAGLLSPPAPEDPEKEDETDEPEAIEDQSEDEGAEDERGAEFKALTAESQSAVVVRDAFEARRVTLWRRFVKSYIKTEIAYRKRMHRFIHGLRVETLRNIEKAFSKQRSRILVDDLIDAILFDPERARRIIQEFSRRYFEEAAEAGATAAAELIPGVEDIIGLDSPAMRAMIEQRIIQLRNIPDRINTEVRRIVREAVQTSIDEGDDIFRTQERVRASVSEVFTFSANRARTIARTEILSVTNSARFVEYAGQGIERIEWLSARDERVRTPDKYHPFDHTIDGEIIVVGDYFSNGLRYPGDPDGEAGNVVNCRCSSLPVISEET